MRATLMKQLNSMTGAPIERLWYRLEASGSRNIKRANCTPVNGSFHIYASLLAASEPEVSRKP